jgi:transcriptional regulator with XRE-family HTH domain
VNVKNLASEVPNQRDLARVLGVSEALISRLMRQRVLRRGGSLAEQVQAFLERELAANGAPASTELEAERIALTRARRQLAEGELAEQRRQSISADDVMAVWTRTLAAWRVCCGYLYYTLHEKLADETQARVIASDAEQAGLHELHALRQNLLRRDLHVDDGDEAGDA